MPDDFTNTVFTTGTISAGGSTGGEIETAFDEDWFSTTLQGGHTYEIGLEGVPTLAGTLSDPLFVGVFNSAGSYQSMSSNDDGGTGLNSLLQFTPSSTGTFFLSARGFGDSTGTYRLSLTDLSGDDFSADTATAGMVSVGAQSMGEIEEAADQDWFGVELQAGRTYQIELRGAPTSDGTLSDTYLRGIHDASGNLFAGTQNDDAGGSLNSMIEFTPGTTGTYFVAAGAYGSNVGTYTVAVTDTASGDDRPDNSSTSGTVAVGGSTTGEIEEAADQDWFGVHLVAGRTYQIDLTGAASSDGTLNDPYIRGLFDGSGAAIPGTQNDDGGTGLDSMLEYTATATGLHYVAAGAYGSDTGTYTLAVTDLGTTDDHGDTPAGAGAVAVGGSTAGAIDTTGDRDWFAVDLMAGQEYQIEVRGSATGDGTLTDPYLRGIFDSAGMAIPGAYDDDGGEGLNSLLSFTPSANGTFFVSAGAYGSDTGTYTVAVTGLGSSDDYASDSTTTGAVPGSGVVSGDIEESGDQDWFRTDLMAGHTYRINLEGSFSDGGTLADPFLRGLFDSSGTAIPGTTNDDGGAGLNSMLEFTATAGGTHFISAGAFGDNTGTYTLTVEDLGGADDFEAGTGTGGAVAVDGTATGSIEVDGDHDWFGVDLVAGRSYVIGLQGASSDGGTLPDTYLRGIHDAGGALIADTANDDGGVGLDSMLEFTATASGRHFIAAGAWGANTGTYTVSVTATGAAADDFTAGTGTTGRVTTAAASTGEIETAGDQDWFRVNLQSGHTYQIDLEGRETAGGTLSDPYLRGIHDSSGTMIAGTANDDGGDGLNSQITFTAASSGNFFLNAGAYGSGVGSYKISIADLGTSDDFSADSSTTGRIAVGGAASGNVESAADQDWFRISLTAGNTYQFDLEGRATTSETLNDPFLRGIHDASGTLIAGTSDDDGGTGLNSTATFTASATGDYFVAAGAYGSGTGSYKLTASQIGTAGTPGDDFAQDTATAGRVSIGGAATGEIEAPGDHDWFGVSLVAGRTYTIDLEGSETSGGTLSDPYLRGLYDSSGGLIAGTADDDGGTGRNAQLGFTATASGTHYIAAGSYGSGTGNYKLSVTENTAAPAPTSNFDIVIDFSGNAAYRSYFDRAAEVWEEVITGDLPNVTDARFGIVDDLRIDAAVTAIDGPGRILGQAGPRDFRTGSSLPYNGMMQFDEADLAGMEAKGILQDVIEHEMGHVLGIGTLWSSLGLSTGFNYTGTNAVREYGTLVGTPQSFVPLETEGGRGTAGSHWSETRFITELMTGFAQNSPPMPLSRLTIGTLQDMGYTVDYDAAEPYTLPAGIRALLAEGDSMVVAGGDGTPPPALTGSLEVPGFAGQRFVSFDDKPLIVTGTPAPIKLEGNVSEASETTVMFFETVTGNDYLVELIGDFDKNDPETADDIKGTLHQVRLFAGSSLVAQIDFAAAGVDVEAALDNWLGYDLALDNLIENRSPTAQNDVIDAGAGDDVLIGGLGDDDLRGGAGTDTAAFDVASADMTVVLSDGGFVITSSQGTDTVTAVERFQFSDRTLTSAELTELAGGGSTGVELNGTPGPDVLTGGPGDDTINGLNGDDRLLGLAGDDILNGGDGTDTLNGGDGNDTIRGGDTDADRRDVIYAGAGDDSVDGGYGNDLIFGQGGNDTIAGGFGADELQGQDGDDVITGSAFGDIVFGNAGNDFVNGGFGHDLINGGTGADKFFHIGGTREQMEGHGSDWVQDYSAAEGDVLVFGGAGTASQFQVNLTHTANKTTGERSGDDDVEEAFVIYRPTGQILWALVDGGGEASINLMIGGEVFDLLA